MRVFPGFALMVVPLWLMAFAQTGQVQTAHQTDQRQPAFSLGVSPGFVAISAGSNAALTVKITRTTGFAGAVKISLSNLPSGLRAAPLTIAASASQGTLDLSAGPNTLPGGPMRLTLSGASGPQTSQAVVRVTINPPGTRVTWLERLNAHRALANLPPVSEEPAWSDGCYQHTRYMIKNQEGEHTEDKTNRWFSEDGLACATSANLSLSGSLTETDLETVDGLMMIPFHGIGMIAPGLKKSAFASYREDGRDIKTAAALDVVRGSGDVPSSVKYPVIWPANGKTVPFTRFGGGEWPDPLSACQGYKAPAGLPILFLAAPNASNAAPKVTVSSFSSGPQTLDHCVFSAGTYKNTDSDQLGVARNILEVHRAVVLIPKAPLLKGASYTVSLTVDGQVYQWSFTVSAQ